MKSHDYVLGLEPCNTWGVNRAQALKEGKAAILPAYSSVETDLEIEQLTTEDLEMVIIPGGLGGVASIRACRKAMDTLRYAADHGKFIGAICAGPTVLADLGITDGKEATCFPGCESGMGSAKMIADAAAVRDGLVITGTSAGCAIPFGLKLIEALKGSEAADAIARQIVIR